MRTQQAAGLTAALAGAAAAIELAHLAPAASWLPPLRRRFFPALAGQGRAGHLALTFDDGPSPNSTPRFADALEALGVRATFFLLGAKLERHPDIARDLVARGHEVALHGHDHRYDLLPRPDVDLAKLRRAVVAFEAACGRRPYWYRPPYGVLTLGRLWAARALDLRPVLWTAWGKDWSRTASVDSVLGALIPDLSEGGTVLLHDSDPSGTSEAWRTTLAALPGLVSRCQDTGWTVGPLRDHGPLRVRRSR